MGVSDRLGLVVVVAVIVTVVSVDDKLSLNSILPRLPLSLPPAPALLA